MIPELKEGLRVFVICPPPDDDNTIQEGIVEHSCYWNVRSIGCRQYGITFWPIFPATDPKSRPSDWDTSRFFLTRDEAVKAMANACQKLTEEALAQSAEWAHLWKHWEAQRLNALPAASKKEGEL